MGSVIIGGVGSALTPETVLDVAKGDLHNMHATTLRAKSGKSFCTHKFSLSSTC